MIGSCKLQNFTANSPINSPLWHFCCKKEYIADANIQNRQIFTVKQKELYFFAPTTVKHFI